MQMRRNDLTFLPLFCPLTQNSIVPIPSRVRKSLTFPESVQPLSTKAKAYLNMSAMQKYFWTEDWGSGKFGTDFNPSQNRKTYAVEVSNVSLSLFSRSFSLCSIFSEMSSQTNDCLLIVSHPSKKLFPPRSCPHFVKNQSVGQSHDRENSKFKTGKANAAHISRCRSSLLEFIWLLATGARK